MQIVADGVSTELAHQLLCWRCFNEGKRFSLLCSPTPRWWWTSFPAWRTRSHSPKSCWPPWNDCGSIPEFKSASADPMNTSSTIPLNSNLLSTATQQQYAKWIELKFTGFIYLKKKQFLGWFGPIGSQRLPTDRAGYSADASQNHRYRRSPLFLQEPQFQVSVPDLFSLSFAECPTSVEQPQHSWRLWFVLVIFPFAQTVQQSLYIRFWLAPFIDCSTWEVSALSGRSGSIALKMWRPSSFAWPCPSTTKCSTKTRPPWEMRLFLFLALHWLISYNWFLMLCVYSEPNAREFEAFRFDLQQQVVHGHVHHSLSQQKGSLWRENQKISSHHLLPGVHRWGGSTLHLPINNPPRAVYYKKNN